MSQAPSNSTSVPAAGRPGHRRRRVRRNAALRLVRRAHLFAGLFMCPWVFLYGLTGFLFNHPEAFPDREVRTAGRAAIASTPLEGFPTAPVLARRVVEALNARGDDSACRLADPGGAIYSRAIVVTATGRGREHSVRFDPEAREAFIRSTAPARDAAATPWPADLRLGLPDPPRDRLTAGVPKLLATLGVCADAAALRNPPDLICTVEQGARRWRVAYNLQTGATSARPVDAPEGRLSTRRFLTGLHLSFTYPSRLDARSSWAVAVDVMAAAMVLWGVSGILMWWQMVKLRGWGLLTLAVSAAVAAAMAAGMHGVLAPRV